MIPNNAEELASVAQGTEADVARAHVRDPIRRRALSDHDYGTKEAR